MPEPSIGRIVHYTAAVDDGEHETVCQAAIVTAVDTYQTSTRPDGEHVGHVSLCVLPPTGMFFVAHVFQDEHKRDGTWHWPERVE